MLARPYPASSVFPIISLQPLPFHEVTHSFAPRRSPIRRVINEFRSLSVVTGGCVLPPPLPSIAPHAVRGVVRGPSLGGGLPESLLWAGKIGLAVASLIFAGHFDLDL